MPGAPPLEPKSFADFRQVSHREVDALGIKSILLGTVESTEGTGDVRALHPHGEQGGVVDIPPGPLVGMRLVPCSVCSASGEVSRIPLWLRQRVPVFG